MHRHRKYPTGKDTRGKNAMKNSMGNGGKMPRAPKKASGTAGQQRGARKSGGEVRQELRRLFRTFCEGTGGSTIYSHSKELWALSAASARDCLPWLAQDEVRKVEMVLPKLVAAKSSASGDTAITAEAFVQCFMDLRRKLQTKHRAAKLLAEAKRLEADGDHASAASKYQSCLADAPRLAAAHFGYAMLLRMTGQDASRDLIQHHLCAAMEFGADEGESREAALKLALVLCQEGDEDERETAADLLLEAGFRLRLADPVLRYVQSSARLPAPERDSEEQKLIAVLEGFMPQNAFKHLQEVFSPTSKFWEEHQYSSYPPSPYFSYLHPLDGRPTSSLDQVIRYVQAEVSLHFPEVAEAACAEWWAHCRPHTHGHQMHFDSDNEGKDGVRNPIVSTVLYLSEGTGGPTLMTTQHVKGSKLTPRGWLAFPRLNRMVVFDGKYLHGVIPGHGTPEGGGRRVTLMVAFWGHQLKERPRGDGRPGACIPGPSPGALAKDGGSSWADTLRPLKSLGKATKPIRVGAQPVQPIWQDVCPEKADTQKPRLSGVKKLPSYDLCFQGF